MRAIRILFIWLFAVTISAAGTVTIVSNLGQSATAAQSFGSAFDTNMNVAGSFTTDNTPGALVSISLHLYGSYHPFGGLGPAVISVNSDTGGQPGNLLATLSGVDYPTNVAVYTFTNTTSLALEPNTTYWVVAASPGSLSNASYSLGLVSSSALDAASFWTLGLERYKIGNESWFANSYYAQMSVRVNPLAPQLSIFSDPSNGVRPIEVSYPTPDYAFDLNQNSALTPGGWIKASGGIMTVQSNRTIVDLPISGAKMFFRLDLH